LKIRYFLWKKNIFRLIQCTLLFLIYFHKQIDRSHEIIIFLAFPLLYISNYYFYLYSGVSIFGPCFKSIGKKTEEPNWKFHPSFHLPSTELFWSNLFKMNIFVSFYRCYVIRLQNLWFTYSNIFKPMH
jgi:hypothetical protein